MPLSEILSNLLAFVEINLRFEYDKSRHLNFHMETAFGKEETTFVLVGNLVAVLIIICEFVSINVMVKRQSILKNLLKTFLELFSDTFIRYYLWVFHFQLDFHIFCLCL